LLGGSRRWASNSNGAAEAGSEGPRSAGYARRYAATDEQTAVSYRFFRRVRIAPGLTINLSKSRPSLSVGGRGAHVTLGGKVIKGLGEFRVGGVHLPSLARERDGSTAVRPTDTTPG
jgi:Protein of unknown function (DUF4236)